jgi:KDO2-lipid IV(A) lauroyltransferase
VLGLAAWSLAARDRYRIARHLTLVYGSALSARRKHNIARAFFVNSGKNLADVVRLRRHFDSEIRPLVTIVGRENMDRAVAKGRGVIGVTGHIGNFELLAAVSAALGYRTAVIGRELYERRLDRLLVGNREAAGIVNFATSDSPRKILRWLAEGNILGVLIDIDSIRVRSTFVPVMGRPALTPVGQTILGLRAGAAFVPTYCVRTPGNRYRLEYLPEIEIEGSGDFDTDVYNITRACTAELDRVIDRYKDQWIWLKNRWLTSPGRYTP